MNSAVAAQLSGIHWASLGYEPLTLSTHSVKAIAEQENGGDSMIFQLILDCLTGAWPAIYEEFLLWLCIAS